ncbi:MAG: alpha/beta hydrolase, partial [Rhizobiaceae bacterium]
QIEQPTSGKPDNAKHFTISRPTLFESGSNFIAGLNQALAQRQKADRTVLVFVHGYNTNFTAAVLRMAQFVHDSGFKGVPVLFTWASRGRAIDYAYDSNSALQARAYLVELARHLAKTNAKDFSIVAHSMGNLVTLEAMTAVAKLNISPRAPLNSVVLASPDVDIDLFREHIKELGSLNRKIFVLISKDDKALNLSRTIAGGIDRVGDAEPDKLAALGVRVVDLSEINDPSSANHSKFADSPAIVQLIGDRINAGGTLETSTSEPTQAAIGSVFRGFRKAATGAGGTVVLAN